MKIENYKVKGMSCGGCEHSVELAVSQISGVAKAKADAKTGTLTVEFTLDPASDETVRAAVEKSGYTYAGR